MRHDDNKRERERSVGLHPGDVTIDIVTTSSLCCRNMIYATVCSFVCDIDTEACSIVFLLSIEAF